MTFSVYESSVPVFVHGLNNLSAILTKAAAYAEAKKIDPSVLVNARIYPDMFPLSRQVQIACDIAKGGVARLAGLDIPSFPDTESSFPELQQRIQKTLAFIQTATPKQMEGSEEKTVSLKVGGKDTKFQGQDYLLRFVNPNFYFHIAITYALLRQNGLDIGKADYLGAVQ